MAYAARRNEAGDVVVEGTPDTPISEILNLQVLVQEKFAAEQQLVNLERALFKVRVNLAQLNEKIAACQAANIDIPPVQGRRA